MNTNSSTTVASKYNCERSLKSCLKAPKVQPAHELRSQRGIQGGPHSYQVGRVIVNPLINAGAIAIKGRVEHPSVRTKCALGHHKGRVKDQWVSRHWTEARVSRERPQHLLFLDKFVYNFQSSGLLLILQLRKGSRIMCKWYARQRYMSSKPHHIN